MIQSKNDLNLYLAKDLDRYNGRKPNIKDWILKNESYFIWRYIEHMRKIEYHQNKGGIHKILNLWNYFCLKHLQAKLHMAIYPNTLGPGFRIYHIGSYTHVGPNVKIGKNCTMVSGIVFGNKTEVEDDRPVIVGDNCYFGIDCKIIGPVHIGNNVSIGANAVVTKDIPDNAIVGGVPARIIKFKE